MASNDPPTYDVKIIGIAQKMLAKIARKHGRKQLDILERVINNLALDPHAQTTQLRGMLSSFRSAHCGRFRIIIKIVDETVRVYVVGAGWHEFECRDDIYAVMTRLVESGAVDPEDFE